MVPNGSGLPQCVTLDIGALECGTDQEYTSQFLCLGIFVNIGRSLNNENLVLVVLEVSEITESVRQRSEYNVTKQKARNEFCFGKMQPKRHCC